MLPVSVRFAIRLQHLRLERNLSVEQFAELAHLSPEQVAGMESSRVEVTLELLQIVADALQIGASELLRDV
jgi:transcriptional regulator with XRE-family HTH domain